MINLNNATETGQGMSNINITNIKATISTVTTLTTDLTNASSLPPITNANSGFGHTATAEQLFATSDPISAALTNLSELSQHQSYDISSLATFNKDIPLTDYEMPSESWFKSMLAHLPPIPPMA